MEEVKISTSSHDILFFYEQNPNMPATIRTGKSMQQNQCTETIAFIALLMSLTKENKKKSLSQ